MTESFDFDQCLTAPRSSGLLKNRKSKDLFGLPSSEEWKKNLKFVFSSRFLPFGFSIAVSILLALKFEYANMVSILLALELGYANMVQLISKT
ncbi:hypothetical protein RhiirC2_792321 [Rhizophagus irregularis]|uniref:Uncharacterized protein n=1 Tax=Rhizophagus irregularis TaxID=588596 RepID=A0A2N1MHJ6_9GLOM|nr:hypothetical protein RhiirC2_792321 [Rhizophagus irregularis]